MSKHKSFIIRCVERARGDDLQRAKMAFKGLNSDQMQEEHGMSGRTRREVLDGYINHDRVCSEAIDDIRQEMN